MPRAAAKKATTAPIAKKPAFDLRIFLDTAGAARKIKRFRQAETIYSQGDTARGVNYIQEGAVQLSVISESGKDRKSTRLNSSHRH